MWSMRETQDRSRRFHTCFAYYSLMGGERASTTRMRLSGQICCVCKTLLHPEPNQRPGERHCKRCAPRHRVYMHFILAKGCWSVTFLEEDLKTSLPRRFVFQNDVKILDLARRGGAEFNLAELQAIEHGISMGRGAVWLSLTLDRRACISRVPAPSHGISAHQAEKFSHIGLAVGCCAARKKR